MDLASLVALLERTHNEEAMTDEFVHAQVPLLSEDEGTALVEHIFANEPEPFVDEANLAKWPTKPRATLVARVLARAPSRERVEALCGLCEYVPQTARREALDGILSGIAPTLDHRGTKPYSLESLHERLVRTLPLAWQEEWIAHKRIGGGVEEELLARAAINCWNDEALRRCWAELEAKPRTGALPSESIFIVGYLPSDLREEALHRLRTQGTDEERRYLYPRFREGLIAEECEDVVATPWNDRAIRSDSYFADHLRRVEQLLPRASLALREHWLERVFALADSYHRQRGLTYLFTALEGTTRKKALEALATLLCDEGLWSEAPAFPFFDDDTIARALRSRVVLEQEWVCSGLVREALLRDQALQDRCFPLVLEALEGIEAWKRWGVLTAMSPWLSEQSKGEIPRWIAKRSG